MAALKFEDVSLYHPRLGRLLEGVSFELALGEWTALVGGTGAGRGALLRLACGLISPSSGRITVFGREVEPGARTSGIFPIFADPDSQFVSPIVEDDLGITLESRGLDASSIRSMAADALARVGLSGYEKRFVTGLSGGEKKRLLLAHGLLTDSRVILFEEPSAMLDRPARTRLFELLGRMARRGRTVLATANRPEGVLAAHRVLVIDGHAVVFDGEVAEFRNARGLISKLGFEGDAARIAGRLFELGETGFQGALTPDEVFSVFKSRKELLI